MKNEGKTFIWSEGWWLEEDEAWFVDGMSNTLFCVDLNTQECEKVICIPHSEEGTYCQHPYCVKCGKDIYCIPGFGENIWIYNLDDHALTEVELERRKQHLSGSQFWIWDGMLFIVKANWNKVIEVCIDQRRITNYYTICENDCVRRGTLVGDKIYAVSSESGRIYQFDLLTKKVKEYMHSDMAKKFFAICYDDEKFWLGGYQKDMYIWNKENNNLTTVSIPRDFKVGDKSTTDNNKLPLFGRAVAVGEYIWFIPIMAEKIVYVNKRTITWSVFEIYEEDKIWISLQKFQSVADYIFQYVREDRYIGLFSAKNGRILEIDTKNLIYQWKDYFLSKKYMQQYCEACEGIYYEGQDPLCIQDYHIRNSVIGFETKKIDTDNIGMKIYTRMSGGLY